MQSRSFPPLASGFLVLPQQRQEQKMLPTVTNTTHIGFSCVILPITFTSGVRYQDIINRSGARCLERRKDLGSPEAENNPRRNARDGRPRRAGLLLRLPLQPL